MWGVTGLWWFQPHPSGLHNNDDVASIGNSGQDQTGFKQGDK